MIKRLLAVQGPVQFVAGYIAMGWLANTVNTADDYHDTLLIYDLLTEETIELEMMDVIRRVGAIHPWRAVVSITGGQMSAITRGDYEGCKRKLREVVGESEFDEIYLARDYCGNGSPLIINAYPLAKRVIYGDSLGVVGCERDYNNFNWRNPVREVLSRCKRSAKMAIFGGARKYPFDVAVLVLPQDMYGSYLNNVPLLIPSRKFVIDNFAAAAGALDDLSAYCAQLLENGDGTKEHVFLLSNLSASGLMSFANEIALYVGVIRRIATPGTRIFLKSHPRGSHELSAAVIEALSSEFTIVEIDDPRFARFPIELWAELINSCTLVPIFSTSGMNVEYIYDTEVILPLQDAEVEHWFYKEKVTESMTSHRSIIETVRRLRNWDGASVLWSGS